MIFIKVNISIDLYEFYLDFRIFISVINSQKFHMKILLLISLFFYSTIILAQTRYTLSQYNVEIIFETENNMFPRNWYNGKINAHVTSLNTDEQIRSLKIIQKTLKKYPNNFIKRHLKKIYILHTLQFFNKKFGGTYSIEKGAIYLSNKGIFLGYTDNYIERTFHAEFSSILLNTYPHLFSKEKWLNYSLVKHGNSGVTALKNGNADTNFSKEFHIKGFLNQYASSSIENDFNSFAKNIFCDKHSFWRITEKYSLIKQKKELIINFYQSLDNQFNESFFKKLH